jgi:DNA-binding transcriptional MerR regulator
MSDAQPSNPKLYGIKEVAQKTGLPASTIRYYDQQFSEFLDVKRGAGRRRLFTDQAVDRLLAVQRMLKEEGLSLRQVRQALGEGSAPSASPVNLPGGLAECKSEIDRLKHQVADLERKLDELKDIQKRTLALVDSLTR